jgi:hypothetical protein
MTGVTIEVRTTGPIFDGRAQRAVEDLVDELSWQVGMDALSEVQLLLDRSIRNPTPYYETQIRIQRRTDQVVIDDRGVVYGPWLEGTGSRNRTTRFKGYASFRRATQAIQARVPQIANRVVRGYLGRMQ